MLLVAVLWVLYFVQVNRRMRKAYLGRIKGSTTKDLTKLDYRRRARYCYDPAKNGNRPFDDIKSGEECRFNCHICGEVFKSKKYNSCTIGSWHTSCMIKLKSMKQAHVKLSRDEIVERARACWATELNGNRPFPEPFNGVKTKFSYRCRECHHVFETNWNRVSSPAQQWCPYCNKNTPKLCGEVSCKMCFAKSAAIHLESGVFEWSAENDLPAHTVNRASNKIYKFDCRRCGHTSIDIAPKIFSATGTGCPYCANSKRCNDAGCHHCYKNSAAVLMERTDLTVLSHTPEELRGIARVSKVDVTCRCGNNPDHVFTIKLPHLTCHNRGCSVCTYKTEAIILVELRKRYGNVLKEKTYDWCINPASGFKLRYDFVIESCNVIIECDGFQHLFAVPYFNKTDSLEDIQARDKLKVEMAIVNGYSIIRLLQKNVLDNHQAGKTDWLDAIVQAIEEVRVAPAPVNFGYAF